MSTTRPTLSDLERQRRKLGNMRRNIRRAVWVRWWSFRTIIQAYRLLRAIRRSEQRLAAVIAARQSIGYRSVLPLKKQRVLGLAPNLGRTSYTSP